MNAPNLKPTTREVIEQLVVTAGADLTGFEICRMDLDRLRFENVCFSKNEPTGARSLQNVLFRDCIFVGCSFPKAELIDVAFRRSTFQHCDFRYATFRNVTFSGAHLEGCDLYRTYFLGNNVFERARIKACSLHLAALEGADIHRENMESAVVQEHREEFERFLRTFGFVASKNIPHFAALAKREAAGIYRSLSGVWAAKGLLGDSTWAYVRARRLEESCLSPRFLWRAALHEAELSPAETAPSRGGRLWHIIRRFPAYLVALIVDWICGFGSSLPRVLATVMFVILFFACVYSQTGALVHVPKPEPITFVDCLNFSLHRMMATVPDDINIGARLEIIAACETSVGVALIGLFGFVFGNYVRNS